MSILDFFRKKKDEINENDKIEKEDASVINEQPVNKEVSRSLLDGKINIEQYLHPDIKGLVWIKDGRFRNYTPVYTGSSIRETIFGILKFSPSEEDIEEPSLIYTTLPVISPRDKTQIPRPPYSPCYRWLSPEQKGIYLELLQNPYNSDIDIGYVFILYYGLERQLLYGNTEKAIDVILKLRDVHKHKSFQKYSANAIILFSLINGKDENIRKFMKSLDKDFEYLFSDNLYLLSSYTADLPLNAKDIMRMAKTFEFTNNTYIKKYPEIFSKHLEGVLKEKINTNTVDLKQYLNIKEIKKMPTIEDFLFINNSLANKLIPLPNVSQSFKLKRDMNIFLEMAHARVKEEVATLRKEGKIQPEPKKEKKEIDFDKEMITKAFERYKEKLENVNEVLGVKDFYDKFAKYSNMLAKGQSLEKINITQAIIIYLALLGETTAPGSTYWERPMILLERLKMYDEALFICERAQNIATMPNVNMGDFEVRLERLRKKCNKK